jgi:hypothetical protein
LNLVLRRQLQKTLEQGMIGELAIAIRSGKKKHKNYQEIMLCFT